jgi:hypothetical protein
MMADGAKAASAQVVAPEVEGASDRRDSARIMVSLLVRDAALGGSFEEHAGNVSIGGVWFDGLHPPAGRRFDVRFLLPGLRDEVCAVAEVLRVTEEGGRFGTHLKFVEIPLDAEMSLARFLQER